MSKEEESTLVMTEQNTEQNPMLSSTLPHHVCWLAALSAYVGGGGGGGGGGASAGAVLGRRDDARRQVLCKHH